ncbi:MAG: hypothetical protein MJ097_02320 [Dorea sp.]|nr:hypothetical protein [Dorea sp.]
MLNLVLLAIGLIALFFGIKNKLKYLIVIGVILLAFGLFSAYVDYRTYGTWSIDNHRIPFTIDHMMK